MLAIHLKCMLCYHLSETLAYVILVFCVASVAMLVLFTKPKKKEALLPTKKLDLV